MSQNPPIPEDIHTQYTALAAQMGDLAFRERDLTAALSQVQESIKTLQIQRMALQKALAERVSTSIPEAADAVETPEP